MAKKEISPEEKLLNLIRNKKKDVEEAPEPQASETIPEKTAEKVFERTAEKVFERVPEGAPEKAPEKVPERAPARASQMATVEAAISKADERISGILKSEIFKSKVFEPATLKSVNRYLVAILCILVLYFIIDLIIVRPSKNVQALLAKPVAGESGKSSPIETKNTAIVKDYSSYSNGVPAKTVFGPSQGGPAASEDVAAGGITDKMGLVGIIAGDNPQAIIEDKKAQKTYYLNKGQSFNGYVVEEISEGKVILDNEGNKTSLFL